jgi:hypothetical protein
MSIVTVVVGCILLWLAVTSRRFRRFVVFVCLLFAIAVGIWSIPDSAPEKQAVKFVAPEPISYAEFMEIPAAELAVTSISVAPPENRQDRYKISGKIGNKSKSATLSSIKMKITVSDCPRSENCVTVGERTVQIDADVPPGRTKSFTRELNRLRGLPARDNLVWNWDVVASYAK